jgi:copper resistance protein B
VKAAFLWLVVLASAQAFAQSHDEHAHHQQQPPAEADPHAAHRVTPPDRAVTQEPSSHVPPDPPQSVMPQMSHEEMDALMEMNDSRRFPTAKMERLEWQKSDEGSVLEWDGAASLGGDLTSYRLESEGEYAEGRTQSARVQLLWDRALTAWWNVKAGVRHDFAAVDRSWAAIGVHGLAPYWIDVDAMMYVSDEGHTAARVKLSTDWLFTQRVMLEPSLELDAYGKDDDRAGLNQGLSMLEAGLRLRYEWHREFAPYVGVVWAKHFGTAADHVREEGEDANEMRFAAGVRFWF